MSSLQSCKKLPTDERECTHHHKLYKRNSCRMMVVPQQSQSCNLHIPSPSHFEKTVRMSLVQQQKLSFRDLLMDNTPQQEIFRHVQKYGIPCKLTSPHKDSKKSFTSACDTCIQGDTFSEKTFKGRHSTPRKLKLLSMKCE
jgi:hypothetical protein